MRDNGGHSTDPAFHAVAYQAMRAAICFNKVGLGWEGLLDDFMGTEEEKQSVSKKAYFVARIFGANVFLSRIMVLTWVKSRRAPLAAGTTKSSTTRKPESPLGNLQNTSYEVWPRSV